MYIYKLIFLWQKKILTDNKNNIFILSNDILNLEGKTFLGISYVKDNFGWVFELTEEEIYNKIKIFFNHKIDFIIAHSPPIYLLDKNKNGENCGSKSLFALLKKTYPVYYICGHIHESYGQTKFENTTIINCSICNENNIITNEAIIIEI